MEKKELIKLPLPDLISVLESHGIQFEPGSRVGTATRDTISYFCDHEFTIRKGDTVELAAGPTN